MTLSENLRRQSCPAGLVLHHDRHQVVKLSYTTVYIGHIVPGAQFVSLDGPQIVPTALFLMLSTRSVMK